MLLAIDTSAGTSVAVVDLEGVVLAEESEAGTRRHAEVVGLLLSAALATAGIRPAGVTAVVAGMGPGPFTGLRVGIAAARAFAIGIGIGRSVIPIVSHDAVAFGRDAPTLVVTDARRREVAWSSYDVPDVEGRPVRRAGPDLARPDDLPSVVDGYDLLDRIDATGVGAGALGALAALLIRSGAPAGPAEPLYLRPPDVTLALPRPVTP